MFFKSCTTCAHHVTSCHHCEGSWLGPLRKDDAPFFGYTLHSLILEKQTPKCNIYKSFAIPDTAMWRIHLAQKSYFHFARDVTRKQNTPSTRSTTAIRWGRDGWRSRHCCGTRRHWMRFKALCMSRLTLGLCLPSATQGLWCWLLKSVKWSGKKETLISPLVIFRGYLAGWCCWTPRSTWRPCLQCAKPGRKPTVPEDCRETRICCETLGLLGDPKCDGTNWWQCINTTLNLNMTTLRVRNRSITGLVWRCVMGRGTIQK